MSETIFALATAAGRGAIAVIRVSGARAGTVMERLAGGAVEPRRATLRSLRDADSGEVLDRGLVLWFPAPASYTGENTFELHLHGGRAVVEAVSRSLVACCVRPAEPGEFTRRAFENDRLDLTEAEAVADLIEAQSDAQRTQALRQLGGSLSRAVATWRDDLLEALALLEAAVDFPDEDLPGAVAAGAEAPLARVRLALELAARDRRGEQVRHGYRVALVGAPNAGKSSLFNALVGRDAAIVSPQAGTTRDIVEARLTLAGHVVVLADTAGVADSPGDDLEREGMRRARAWAEAADLRLHVDPRPTCGLSTTRNDWVVLSKCDLAPTADVAPAGYRVSVVSNFGIDRLRDAIGSAASLGEAGEAIVATRARHREAFARAAGHLERAKVALAADRSPEFAAEDVRLAARALETLSGRIDAEDVLGRVFSSFCIGK